MGLIKVTDTDCKLPAGEVLAPSVGGTLLLNPERMINVQTQAEIICLK